MRSTAFGRSVPGIVSALPSHRARPETVDRIMQYIAGGKSIRDALKCVRTEGYRPVPTRQGFLWRVFANPDLLDHYRRAKAAGIEATVDTLRARITAAGKDCTDSTRLHAEIARCRLYVDTVKWEASKLAPKVYGDKLQHEHTGNIAIAVVTGLDIDPVAHVQQRITVDSPLLADSANGALSHWGTDDEDDLAVPPARVVQCNSAAVDRALAAFDD